MEHEHDDQFGTQRGSLARPGPDGPKLTPAQAALAEKNRAEYAEERRALELHHRHGDTSGGTTDAYVPQWDEVEEDEDYEKEQLRRDGLRNTGREPAEG